MAENPAARIAQASVQQLIADVNDKLKQPIIETEKLTAAVGQARAQVGARRAAALEELIKQLDEELKKTHGSSTKLNVFAKN